MSSEGRRLLLEIAGCEVMVGCLEGERLTCRDVVLSQCPSLDEQCRRAVWRRKHQLPTPWARAPGDGAALVPQLKPVRPMTRPTPARSAISLIVDAEGPRV